MFSNIRQILRGINIWDKKFCGSMGEVIFLNRIKTVLLFIFVILLTALPTFAGQADRVVLISFDGLRPDFISSFPNFTKLLREGSYTLKAKTVLQSVTLPAHVSMLTGVSPKRHKVIENYWLPWQSKVKTTTLFQRIKRSGKGTAMVCGKEKLGVLAVSGSLDEYKFIPFTGSVEKQITSEAVRIIKNSKINFLFIHYPFPDHGGHAYGWGSRQYVNEIARMDKELGHIMEAINKESKLRTMLIVTADHGGHNRRHGSDSPEDSTIPWIVWGKMVGKGVKISAKVNIVDTAAVVLDALGIPGSIELEGKKVPEIWNTQVKAVK